MVTRRSASESKKASLSPSADEVYAFEREALRIAINEHGIHRVPMASHEMRSIDDTSWYWWQFYLRGPLLVSRHLRFIAHAFWKLNAPRWHERAFQLATIEQAGLPVITAIIMAAPLWRVNDLHAFTVRKTRKDFGRRNIIEGEPDRDLPVLLVDDLTSIEHNSIWHAITVISRAGLKLDAKAFVVVFKGQRHTSPRILETSLGRVTIESIYTLNDFNLTFEEYRAAKTWSEPMPR